MSPKTTGRKPKGRGNREPGKRYTRISAAEPLEEWYFGDYTVRRRGTKVLIYYQECHLVCHADLHDDGAVDRAHYVDVLPIEMNHRELHARARAILQARPWVRSSDT